MLFGNVLTIIFVPLKPMGSFDIIIKEETYTIVHNSSDKCSFIVFNHTTCHIIKKNDKGFWEAIQHRFGTEHLPLNEIGHAIDSHYSQQPAKNSG
jgi:hypothetical protein